MLEKDEGKVGEREGGSFRSRGVGRMARWMLGGREKDQCMRGGGREGGGREGGKEGGIYV